MSGAEKVVRARELREQGKLLREIAAELGVTTTTALRWVDPEKAERDREAARAWKERNRAHVRQYDHQYARKHRGTCTECGGPMGAHVTRNGLCRSCVAQGSAATASRLEELWAQGKTYSEIQAAMGWSRGMVSMMLDYYRQRGHNLPHRYDEARRAKATQARRKAAA